MTLLARVYIRKFIKASTDFNFESTRLIMTEAHLLECPSLFQQVDGRLDHLHEVKWCP